MIRWAQGTQAQGIDGNTVVGVYYDGSGNPHGFIDTLSPVPEPSTLALASLGAAALTGFLWRRRQTKPSAASGAGP